MSFRQAWLIIFQGIAVYPFVKEWKLEIKSMENPETKVSQNFLKL